MPILLLFGLLPLGLGTWIEYLVCRFARRKFWRWIPPTVILVLSLVILLARYRGWSDSASAGAPWETLLIMPGIPAILLLAGTFLGRQIWKRMWEPRVFNEKRK